MEVEKIGFFKRIKIAIFNLEKYQIFANEKFSKALKYLMLLVFCITIILAISTTVKLSIAIEKFINYTKSDEFPDFNLTNGALNVEKNLNAYDEEYNARLIIDTKEDITEEEIANYKKETKYDHYSVIFLRNKIIYKFDSNLNEGITCTYGDVNSLFGIQDINKDQMINDFFNQDNIVKLKAIIFIYAVISIFLLNILTLLEDIIIIGLVGWITGKIARVTLTLSKSMSLAIYSLSLSIILSTVYSVVYSFTNFQIKYFEVMYMLIAYIYIVAAVMIMKESNRTAGEVVTVDSEVIKTDEDDQKDKEDDDKETDKKEVDKKNKLPKNKEEKIPENQEGQIEGKE